MKKDSMRTNAKPASADVEYRSGMNVLVAYVSRDNFTNTVYDYLAAFQRHSEFAVHYVDVGPADYLFVTPMEAFDAVILFYSVPPCLPLLSESSPFLLALKNYSGVKVVIIQDEYDYVTYAQKAFAALGMDIIVTSAPRGYERAIYPEDILPNVSFIHALTGYVPDDLLACPGKPLEQRRWAIGYRGRALHYKYGDLGQEKLLIGQRMRAICEERGIPANIEWEEGKRLYGPAWPEFLQDCRVTLGTESGSTIFDFKGDLRERIDAYLAENPQADYSVIRDVFLKDQRQIPMETISPRLFEAIALGTGLVLFEGGYSDVLQPWQHYIPLKKDWSNIDEVLEAVSDDERLTRMTRQAHADVVASGRYTYDTLIKQIDAAIQERIDAPRGNAIVYMMTGCKHGREPMTTLPLSRPRFDSFGRHEEAFLSLCYSYMEPFIAEDRKALKGIASPFIKRPEDTLQETRLVPHILPAYPAVLGIWIQHGGYSAAFAEVLQHGGYSAAFAELLQHAGYSATFAELLQQGGYSAACTELIQHGGYAAAFAELIKQYIKSIPFLGAFLVSMKRKMF
ncbi:MAG: hypothetical protein FWH34_00885 [Desulfovibrionaceae bacterium]|nr:hypothetical protein [Desulfovibrionaceae bacterium]